MRGERRIDQLGKEGQTLLHLALIEGRGEWIPLLLRCGANPRVENSWGMSVRELAKLLRQGVHFSPFAGEEDPPIFVYRGKSRDLCSMSATDFSQEAGFTYIDTLEFRSVDALIWIARKCAKALRRPVYRRMNNWVLALCEEAIRGGVCEHIYVRWIDERLGYGVFAARDLPALTYIGEYTGVVRRRRFRRRWNDYTFGYVAGPWETPWVIDAEERGNFSRLINHSDEPNLISRWVICNGVTRIILFSTRFIPKGMQLTYDYGCDYWATRSPPLLIR